MWYTDPLRGIELRPMNAIKITSNSSLCIVNCEHWRSYNKRPLIGPTLSELPIKSVPFGWYIEAYLLKTIQEIQDKFNFLSYIFWKFFKELVKI